MIFFSSYLFLIELNPLISLYDYDITLNFLFISGFIFFITLNYIFTNSYKKNNLDLDLITKFFALFLKTPSYLLNYFVNIFKKIFLYLVYFKYRNYYFFTKFFYKKYFNSFFLIWKPLFKKTSYFGYYRSNRSKWIK